jgi:putative RNA 2'-phosphotransferase
MLLVINSVIVKMEQPVGKTTSKFLSLILRHKPEIVALKLDENGWASTDELLLKLKIAGREISFDELKTMVETNEKQRFAFSEDFNKIRANQGHSIEVDLNLKELAPPHELYHGTAIKYLSSIRQLGIIKGKRHHVHLSSDVSTASSVGQRHGKPVVLRISSGMMYEHGHKFYLTENGVWLTETVPPEYIRIQ